MRDTQKSRFLEDSFGMLRTPRVTVEATVAAVKGRAVFSYRLTNTGCAALGEFALAVPAGAVLRAFSAPPGWLARLAPADGCLIWQLADPLTDLVPGRTLGGFRFQACAYPGLAAYHVRQFAADGRTVGHSKGITQAPVALPEELGAERKQTAEPMYRFSANPAVTPGEMLSSGCQELATD